jgi:hypothetical protein
MSLKISNIGTQTLNSVNFSITETDPYITLVDSTETIPVITGGQIMTLANAFCFNIASNIPDNHSFMLVLHVNSQEQNFQWPIELMAHAPVFRITGTKLSDGDNGMPDPGESADLLVTYKNEGSAKASSINVQLTSLDTNLTLNVSSGVMNLLKPDSSKTLTFHATASSEASFEHIYKLQSTLGANNNFSAMDTLYLFSGQIVEDFESGDFSKFPWYSTGQWPWFIEPGAVYEGVYSTRSGVITNNAESIFNISARVLAAGEISFYKYVSCEFDPSGSKNYDYMAFFIDGFEMGRWDGIIPWSKETFQVSAGFHILSWVYHKDYSAAAGWDGCLLDFITLPLIEGTVPELSVTPLSFEKSIETGHSTTDELHVTNLGGGIMKYSVMVFDTTANKQDDQSDNLTGSYVTCNTEGFVPGQAINWMFAVHNQSADNEYIRHIKLDFPPGVLISGATNFSGGSLGEFTFLGIPGDGASLNWHGESTGGRGVLKPGETAYATVTGIIGESFMNDAFVVYDLRGDSLGTLPHKLPGNIKVKNYGLANSWVSLTNTSGNLMHNQSATVSVNIDATGLVPKTYQCDLVARDFYNNKFVIPVTLHVTFPVAINNPKEISETRLKANFPNPFTGETQISFELPAVKDVTIEIYSLQGMLLRSWKLLAIPAGEQFQSWDGKDYQGYPVPPGVYTCRMKTNDYQGSLKMVLIR